VVLVPGKTLRYGPRVKRLASLALVAACGRTPPPATAHIETAPIDGTEDGWLHTAYFTRLKRAVYGEWQPSRVWNALPLDERTKAPPTRTTVVRAEILPDGSVWSLTVKTSSGMPTLDQECLRAFRAAAPFPNPPHELFKDSVFGFDFAFNLDTDSREPMPAAP
jgi:TonB family protein